jgi:hypothetical protein
MLTTIKRSAGSAWPADGGSAYWGWGYLLIRIEGVVGVCSAGLEETAGDV